MGKTHDRIGQAEALHDLPLALHVPVEQAFQVGLFLGERRVHMEYPELARAPGALRPAAPAIAAPAASRPAPSRVTPSGATPRWRWPIAHSSAFSRSRP